MLSVLIPTYNYTCYRLVADLLRQLESSGVPFEVIVAEDGSRDQVSLIANLKINELPNCRVIRRKENVGRAAIRNFLVREAVGEWLLLMDSDARVLSDDFVEHYLTVVGDEGNKEKYDIIAGGLCHADALPSPEVSLRYRYEKAADAHRSAEERQRNPFAHFTTFNILVRKELLQRVPFDENCKEYGYEDTLLGEELKASGARILHVDNPLEHVGLESNAVYLAKVEASLRTLKGLGDKMVPYTRLGQTAMRLKRNCLAGVFCLFFTLAKPLLRRNILGKTPSLTMLNIYKLGYFLSL